MTDARTKCIELEAKVLELSGLELNKELFVYDVTINLNGKNRLIHTYRCGSQNKDTLVLLHGYAGSSVLYYKMLKTLSQKFKVYCVDIVGMALSSKEEFTCTTTEETIDFLTGFVEEWRKASNILEPFTIAGHSFGAYVSTQYTLKYPERVKKLNMLSPVGFTDPLNDAPEDQVDNSGWFKKTLIGWVKGYAQKQIDNQVTPISYIKDHSWIGNWAVKNYVYKRFGLKEKEADVVYEFLWAMLNLPEGSEKAIHHILKPPRMSAVVPLEEHIKDIKVPIDCYYGEKDYMNTNGAKRVHQKKVKDDFVIKILAGAAHQVTVQNPQDLADQIVVSALV